MSVSVLIADPEPLLLDTYRQFLSRDGFEVATAATGSQCLEMLVQKPPDVLVLEPDLTGPLGGETLETIYQCAAIQRVPVLILTRLEQNPIEYPVHNYYVKPFSLTQLAHSIRSAVQRIPAHSRRKTDEEDGRGRKTKDER